MLIGFSEVKGAVITALGCIDGLSAEGLVTTISRVTTIMQKLEQHTNVFVLVLA